MERGTIKGGADWKMDLWKYHKILGEILSECMGKPFGRGVDAVKIRGDAIVPEKYALDLMRLVGKLHTFSRKTGGKTRFRVKKYRRTNGYHVKDFLDLYKRLTDLVVGHNAFVLQKPQKIVVGRKNGKRVQRYTYTFKWRHT